MEHSDKLFQLLNGLKKLAGRPVNIQMQSLTRLSSILDKMVEETPAPFKVFYKKAYNGVKSLHDGLASDDANEKDVKQIVEDVRNLWDDCKKLEYKKSKNLPTSPEFPEEQETLQDMHGIDMKKEGQALLQKYAKYKQVIVKKLLGKRFKATRAPVIAITKNMLLSDKLKQVRLSTGSFEGYPVIDNQVLVGLDMDWVNIEYKKQIKPAVDYILESLKEKTGKNYLMMGGAKRVGFVLWVWLATDLDLKKLSAATAGGHFILKSWSFPFQGDYK